MLLVTEWFGSFLLEGRRVEEARLFPQDAREVAARLHALDRGEVLEEERVLAEGQQGLKVAEPRLISLGRLAAPISVRAEAEKRGFDQALLRGALLELAKAKAKAAMGGRDQHVVQAVQASDDLAETANQLAERLREWYGLHFPESDRLVERHEEMATLVSMHGTRDAMLAASPHIELPESFGADLGPEEQAALRGFAKSLSSLYSQRAEIDAYLEKAVPGIAPNVTKLVGPIIAARLLFHAGGLLPLAKMSSGTVQTLGAEKALFRHLKEGNRPPKHGVIFQHALIHRAPFRQRGPLARALAGKVSIAARADAFTKADIAEGLLRSLEQRAGEVRNAPPKRPRTAGAPPIRAPYGRPPPGRAPPQGRPPERPPERRSYQSRPPPARAAGPPPPRAQQKAPPWKRPGYVPPGARGPQGERSPPPPPPGRDAPPKRDHRGKHRRDDR